MQLSAIIRKPVFLAILLAAAAASLYLPSLSAEFVYDDRALILISDYIHDWHNLGRILSFRVLADDVPDNCRPVYLLTILADAAVWGKLASGYHLTNILLHAANTVLLFLFLLRVYPAFSGQPGSAAACLLGAAGGALFFAVHPAASEAVCVATYREDLLAAFFILLGLNLAARFPGCNPAGTWLVGAATVFFFLAAGASKETGLAGAPLVTLYALLTRRRPWDRRWIVLLAAVWLVDGLFLLSRFIFMPAASAIFMQKPGYLGGSFLAMLQVQPRLWVYQLQLMVWPAGLCADQGPYNLRQISLATALLVLAGLAAALLLFARRRRAVWLAAGLCGLPLLPVSNFIPIFRPLADRYLYLPVAGLALIVGLALLQAQRRGRRYLAGLGALFLVAVGALAFLTLQREAVWHDEVSLWTDTLNKNPASATAANNLAFALYDRAEYAAAVQSWSRAIKLAEGREADHWAGLAIGRWKLGQRLEAVQAYRQAVALNSAYAHPQKLVERLTWDSAQAAALQTVAVAVRIPNQ